MGGACHLTIKINLIWPPLVSHNKEGEPSTIVCHPLEEQFNGPIPGKA